MLHNCIILWCYLPHFPMSKHLQSVKSFKSISHWEENLTFRCVKSEKLLQKVSCGRRKISKEVVQSGVKHNVNI